MSAPMRKKKIQIKVRTIGIIIDLTRSSRRDFLSDFLNAAETGMTMREWRRRNTQI